MVASQMMVALVPKQNVVHTKEEDSEHTEEEDSEHMEEEDSEATYGGGGF